MKRWIISAAITLGLILVLLISSSFIPETQSGENKPSSSHSVVTVLKNITTVRKAEKKDTKQKPKEKKKTESAVPAVPVEAEPEPEPEQTFADETAEANPELPESEYESEAAFSEEAQKAEASYKKYALMRIDAKKVYPIAARAKGQEGRVKIHAVIDTDGALLAAEITSACEFDILNEAALNAVKKSAPFKKMQPGARKLELNFTMEFALN